MNSSNNPEAHSLRTTAANNHGTTAADPVLSADKPLTDKALEQQAAPNGAQKGGPKATPPVSPEIQAAQLEHTSESLTDSRLLHGSSGPSHCALAGGEPTPQSPLQGSHAHPEKKHQKKRRDNHVSTRISDDENDIVTRRMKRTGETQSEAIRAIIRESEHTEGHVYLSPKTPPDQFETLLGELRKWRRDFATAKPRLNIPTPKDDDRRYVQVQAWRKEADRLLAEIPKIEVTVTAVLRLMTSLTSDRVEMLKASLPEIRNARQAYLSDGKRQVETFTAFIELIEDLGIGEK